MMSHESGVFKHNSNCPQSGTPDERNIHLSGLMDDQVVAETIDELMADQEQAQTWFRYHQVRAVLSNEDSGYSSFAFTQKLSALIDQEPALNCSKLPTSLATEKPSAQILPFWQKPATKKWTGFAVAASVAMATVFSVQLTEQATLPESQPFIATHTAASPATVSNLKNSPFNDAEQAELEAIQAYLDKINRSNVQEQLVGGEYFTKSYLVESNQGMPSLETRVRQMRKPSEVEKHYR